MTSQLTSHLSRTSKAGIAALSSIALLLAGGSLAYGATASNPDSGAQASASAQTVNAADTTSAHATYKKDQNIYGILNSDGASKDVYVVNQFKVTKAGNLTDYGDYDSTENLSSTKKLESSGGEQSIAVAKGDFYYQGDLTSDNAQAQLPWNVGITYTLDGKDVAAKDLAGASGRVGVKIHTAKNKNSTEPLYYKKYMLQISFTVPSSKVNSIDAGDSGIVADAGANKQLTYTVMPGKDGDLSFAADATNFSMSAISIAAAPFSMDLGDTFDTSSLTSGMEKLADGTNKLADGSSTLAANSGSLSSGTATLANGATSLATGTSTFTSGVAQFGIGLTKVSDGATSLATGAHTLSSGISQYTSGISTLAKGSASLNSGISQLSSGVAKAAKGTSQYSKQLSQQAQELGKTANTTTITAASRKYQTALTDYSTAMSTLAATQPMKLLAVQNVQNGLPDPVSDPSGYRAGLVSAISAQSDTSVENILSKILALTDAQTNLTTLAGKAGSAQALSGAADGAAQIDSGMQQLASGASKTAAGSQSFNEGAQKAAKAGSALTSGAKKYAKGTDSFASGMKTLKGGASSLTGGAQKLSSGSSQLASGATTLASGVSQFASGVNQLDDGISTLATNTEKIPSTMKKEIDKAMENFSGDVTPIDFISARNKDVSHVQFMLTTSAIEKKAATKTVKDSPTPSFVQRLKNLFTGTKSEE
ncbi:MAG: hypothetical protein LKI93_06485 [Bifidobacteriaceae bacterium]|jgi:X-X-X-Leu-X-X-Gly heptad repeat protein|nr:hypothetical protein [Bifidobacteriaceae bacterium]MCI1915550.1 hypothetical protein [Bifidobacteriaceae bacterium]